MFYHFLYPLYQDFPIFNIFRYITFRSIVSFMLSVIISIWLGKWFIKYMSRRQFGQVVREDGPATHLKKAGTPTMGGIFILGSILVSVLLTGNFLSYPLLASLFVMLSYFILGFLDDYLKVLKKNSDGVSGRVKLLWQALTGALTMWVLVDAGVIDTSIYLPFVKGPIFALSPFLFICFGTFVVVSFSNAVNLTDGLDGLAIGPIITSSSALGILSYVAGHVEIASYLFIPYIQNAGELLPLAASIVGAGVGFLWYNSYPAQVFMGDVGSLSMGGVLGIIAVLTKNEFLFVLIGGIFVLETVSVVLQVSSFKLRGKRIFKMAPIHHHFELTGWPEPKVIVRFWIISIFLAIFGVATLKMR